MIKGVTYRSFAGGMDATKDPVEAMTEAHRMGYESIELATGFTGKLSLDSGESVCRGLRKEADRIGIRLSSLATVLHWKAPLTADDPAVRRKSVEATTRVLEQASWLGVDTILIIPGHVDIFFKPEAAVVSYDAAYERSLAGLRELRTAAERVKVSIAVENVWSRFLLSPIETRDFIDKVDSPWVGMYFDVGNCFLNGYPEQWISILGKRIRRVHVKDFKRSVATVKGFCPLFDGEINWRRVMDALRAIGYDGYVSAEMMPPEPGLLERTSGDMDVLLGRKPGLA